MKDRTDEPKCSFCGRPQSEVQKLIAPLAQWTEKEQTQAEVEVFILDHVYQALPDPPYTEDDKRAVAALVYRHVWQQSAAGLFAGRQ